MVVVQRELQREGTIGHAATPLEHGQGLVQHLFKGHGLPFSYPRVPASPRLGPIVLQRRLLGDKLPRDIFVEHAADQGVIGDSLPSGTVLEGLEVHLGESNGQAL